jgi:signal transduction histidine kinase
MNAWRRLSIATKLPLVLGTLLVIVLGSMTLAAYWEVRRSALEASSERLGYAAQTIANAIGDPPSQGQRYSGLRALSRAPAVSAYLRTPDSLHAAPAADTISTHIESVSRGRASVELWSSEGQRLLQSGHPLPALQPAAVQEMASLIIDTTNFAIGPLQLVGDSLYLTLVMRVMNPERAVGYLIERRPVTASSSAVSLLNNLIGSEARLLVGNAAGDVWTDFSVPVPGPPIDLRGRTGLVEYTREGIHPVFARVVPTPNTPWLTVVEFPRDTVLAPSLAFLGRAGTLSIALIAVGVLAALLVSRQLSVPLQRVTTAAEAIAAGNLAKRVQSNRLDEVGRLATSFNTMAQQVEEGRRELEQRVLERTSALQAANRELEAFSYSVSHDLRAPLRAIGGFANILIEDHSEHLPTDVQRRLEVIVRNSRQMGQLIDDLLAFSRLGRQQLVRTNVDMSALAQSVAEDARRADPDREIELVIKPLPSAHGEPVLLRQVLTNLIHNAFKFTSARRPARVEIGHQQQDGQVTYYVKDNGVGFDMQYAEKLFGVFQRLHLPEQFEGTGVGLAIVQRIIERHGGRVWAEAVVDQGATFFFSLPVNAS